MAKMNTKSASIVAAGVVGVVALVGAAYFYGGMKQAPKAPESAMQLPVAGQLKAGAQAPPNHPQANASPENGAAAAGAAPAQAGKVKVDPNAKFTHFRVGNRNVKSMLLEGKVLWVGTSGGVIRYDTSTDDYRLFDARNGLLSNGIFHVSRLGDKILAGTYGGGMSLYDPTKDTWGKLQHSGRSGRCLRLWRAEGCQRRRLGGDLVGRQQDTRRRAQRPLEMGPVHR